MNRSKPSDPIVYPNDQDGSKNAKQSFEERGGASLEAEHGDDEDDDGKIRENDEEDQKPSYFRPNFNVPQTMRGIKNLSLGLGIKQDGKTKAASKAGIRNF